MACHAVPKPMRSHAKRKRARAQESGSICIFVMLELQIYFLIKNPPIYSISIVVLITNISTFELSALIVDEPSALNYIDECTGGRRKSASERASERAKRKKYYENGNGVNSEKATSAGRNDFI